MSCRQAAWVPSKAFTVKMSLQRFLAPKSFWTLEGTQPLSCTGWMCLAASIHGSCSDFICSADNTWVGPSTRAPPFRACSHSLKMQAPCTREMRKVSVGTQCTSQRRSRLFMKSTNLNSTASGSAPPEMLAEGSIALTSTMTLGEPIHTALPPLDSENSSLPLVHVWECTRLASCTVTFHRRCLWLYILVLFSDSAVPAIHLFFSRDRFLVDTWASNSIWKILYARGTGSFLSS